MEVMTEEGQVFLLEGGNKGSKCFLCGEVGHMAGSCPRNAWSKNGENWKMWGNWTYVITV